MDALKLFLLMIAVIIPIACLSCLMVDGIMRYVRNRWGE